MSAALPPVPDLIPISALRKGSTTSGTSATVGGINNNNEEGKKECAPCSSTQCSEGEVMGEQRSRRTGQPGGGGGGGGGTADLIDTSRSRGSDGAAPQPASRKARTERHRKSDRRRDRVRERRRASSSKASSSSVPASPERQPRVNPIFVWVRQRDTQIVEVKCEDYDKRNRILLTKTAQGWRAIPRTETLAPALQRSADKPQRKVKKKVKRKSTAVQVDDWTEPLEEEEQQQQQQTATPDEKSSPANVNSPERSAQDTQDGHNNNRDATPLDNLLAVAELEFNQHIGQEQWDEVEEEDEEDKDDAPEADQISNMEQLDMFIESCAPPDPPSSEDPAKSAKSDADCECDYTEEDDNNIAMDDILSRLEQSLRSPDTLHPEVETPKEKEPQESPTDLTTTKYVDDIMPTDLSVPRPPSQNSETIQSPQPSGIPAVPPSPDLYSANKSKSAYLESLLSPAKEPPAPDKEPLDLGKARESDSPKVTCSQEVDTEPPAKKIKVEDITLKTLLDNEVKNAPAAADPKDTPRLLELLTEVDPDPVLQLKQILASGTINVPDPMLIPKDRLSQILQSPAKEIPKLLSQRPELRLPEALAYPHLLQDPDILVITLAQLETIVQKQSQALPLVDTKAKKPESTTISSSMSPPKNPPEKSKKAKMTELSNDIDAATNAAFTQMMWLPYLNQLEMFGGNSDFLKMLSTMLPSYPLPPEHRLPFPPPFPMQPQLNYNPLELGMWQEAMMHQVARTKSQLDLLGKDVFPKPQLPNPYLSPFPPTRPNLQIPQYNPNNPKYPKASKPSPTSTKSGYGGYQSKAYEHHKPYAKPKVACKPFANLAAVPEKRYAGPTTQPSRLPGPIDLSGPTTTTTTSTTGKLKVKQHLVDQGGVQRLLHHHHRDDNVPEVGSTTASIEEMQDAQKHLWHPLFGNQKSYSSPWNWTTVTATGE